MVLELIGAVAAFIISLGLTGLILIATGVLMALLGGVIMIPFLLVVKAFILAGRWLAGKLF